MKRNPSNRPPRASSRILNWLLDDDWETPAGDFEEAFHQFAQSEGYSKARRWYRIQLLRLLPERMFEKSFWGIYMLRTNLKITVRSLRKNPAFAAINIGGLAIGMAAFLLISLFIKNELNFDKQYADSDLIFRVNEAKVNGEGSLEVEGFSRAALGPAAVSTIPEVTNHVRLIGPNYLGRSTVTTSNAQFYEGAYYYTEPSFFEIFNLPFLAGDPTTALAQPNSTVLTESAALKYFGRSDVVGSTLQVEGIGDMTVTAVLHDLADNTHLSFSLLFSASSLAAIDPNGQILADWSFPGVVNYLKLAPLTSEVSVSAKLESLFSANVAQQSGDISTPELQALQEIHFGSGHIQFEDNARESNRAIIWIFGLVAALIVLIAVINYTNMTTAGSMKRAKEVGLRKAVGAHRGQLARQFFGESLVTVMLSVVLAIGLAVVALPGFNAIMGKSMTFSGVLGISFISSIVLMLIGIGIMSGIFPALFLSSLGPIEALKGRPESISGTPRLRQVLVAAQFTLSIGLIICSLIVLDQMKFIQNTDLGFEEDQLLVVDINSGTVRRDFKTILTEYRAVPGVRDVSVSSRIPGDWKDIRQIDARNATSSPESIVGSFFIGMDEKFLSTYQIDLIEGRNISLDSGADSMSVLINETAARSMNLAVGDHISVPGSSLSSRFSDRVFEPQVVGIVNDFNFQSLHQSIGPMVLGFYSNPIQSIDYFTIKLSGAPSSETMDQLQAIGKRFDPERPWEINFLDSRLQDFYESEARFKNVFSMATALAILIACLGLLGLTTFTVVRRTKEIGIRKVMGSSSVGIVGMLSKEIAVLVAISFLISAPLSWIIMNRWLADFAYHTSVNPLTILLSGGIALLCALGTVSYQSIRASKMNPVQCLRYE